MKMSQNSQTMSLIKGLLATVIGAMLIIVSYGVIIKMLIFIGGIVLLRRGLLLLNNTEFERIIKGLRAFFKQIIS
jgi:hypothetical protein